MHYPIHIFSVDFTLRVRLGSDVLFEISLINRLLLAHQAAMKSFVTKIVDLMKENDLFAYQGGPVIMAQVGVGESVIDHLI